MESSFLHIRSLLKNDNIGEFIYPTSGTSSHEDNQNTDDKQSTLSNDVQSLSLSYESDDSQSEIDSCLTPFEQIECLNYKHLYYGGTDKQEKIDPIRLCTELPNTLDKLYDLFNDKKGFYRCIEHDHIAYRYEIIECLGNGTYGKVVKAIDHKHYEYVAVKIGRARRYATMHHEAQMILHAKKCIANCREFIVMLKNCLNFRQHSCLIFELHPTDITGLLEGNDFERTGFSMPVVKRLTKKLLISLAHLHEHHIMHGDLKPDNLLKCRGKIDLKVSEIVTFMFL